MERKELVIIAGSCYPIPSATGSIALKCAEYLKNDYNVRLICLQENKEVLSGEMINDIHLYSLTNWRYKWYQSTKGSIKKNKGYKKRLAIASHFLNRSVGRLLSAILYPDSLWWYKDKIIKLLDDMHGSKPIDVILSINAPIESHVAAYQFKKRHPDVKWVSYWGDLYCADANKLNLFFSLKKMKALETKLLQSSDIVLTTEEVFEVYKKYDIYGILDKMSAVPYYLKEDILNMENVPDEKEHNITCTYMGSLYKKIRNPEYMLKVFSHKLLSDVFLHLYTTGDCSDIVRKYEKDTNTIREHGIVPPEELCKILLNSDVLINIDNSESSSKPSKLLELMSYRKPIINFSTGKKEIGEVFDRYPLGIRINSEDAVEIAAFQINEFVSRIINNQYSISADDMRNLFINNTEDYSKNIIVSKVKDAE